MTDDADKLDAILAKLDAIAGENAKLQAQTLALTALIVNLSETKTLPADRLGSAVELIANSNNVSASVRADANNMLSMIEQISQERR